MLAKGSLLVFGLILLAFLIYGIMLGSIKLYMFFFNERRQERIDYETAKLEYDLAGMTLEAKIEKLKEINSND